ncbi:electron transport complex subunit RsxA [Alkaliphilus oremlandii]|uniref:Ion-translocating oxidoreductase complex subunit A n=1 Tax=Alkaliphilus oremlandii (strain OhILAs) TaxID=350688 RepID=A8MHM9_ALKOO|nr:electron transport complex subunit RsxA [Alkaliphilus oremlandii]ABW19311.1 electron transport complex, RnfABCDGE type, A subunit [Alkaliphilus oremlandii OhILAs]
MTLESIFVILVGGILVNNYVLSRNLGICPFLGVSKQVETAFGMGMAVTFVMTLAGLITYLVQTFILNPLGLGYMQTVTFILVIAALVQFVEMVIQKSSPTLYQSLGVYLPLITTNCAVLGVAILNIKENYNLIETIVNSAASAIGFSLAIVLFAGIRERLELSNIPEAFKGFPIALFTASLMSMAFLGFSGLV